MKKRSKSKLPLILIIILLILIISGFIFVKYFDLFSKTETNEPKIIKEIDKYDYQLEDNKSKEYKDTFKELENILKQEEINYEKYAEVIAKLFIIDFYTLDNKTSKNDIGGARYVLPDFRDNFIENARSTFYRYIKVNDKSKDILPHVNNINSVEVLKTTFKFTENNQEKEAYKVSINWSYKTDLDYETSAKMILVKEDKYLYVVEMN